MADAGRPGGGRQRPSRAYEAGVDAGQWLPDSAQRAVLPHLDRLHDAVLAARPERGWLGRLRKAKASPTAEPGLYLWGGVGRGKTFLLDLLADSLPEGTVLRRHFHRFMAGVHAALNTLRESGTRDPLRHIAEELAGRHRLLCLDEFVVHDIGDAMLLAGLLQGLFDQGVLLATTSNTVPAQLYRDGLQRSRFLPAIALLERHCAVVELVSPVDYRLRSLTRAPVYLVPADAEADTRLRERFLELAHASCAFDTVIEIEGRTLPARGLSDGVAWFDFAVLCEGPRATADYIELARDHHTVLLSGVPQFTASIQDDAAKRFIHLVDELYDRRVNLLLTAAVPPTQLYTAGRLRSQFERTESRLIQMQSGEYLAEEHRQ